MRVLVPAVLLVLGFGRPVVSQEAPRPAEFEGVRRVWVSASQWPNSRTQETFAKDAVRLYGAQNGTEQEKAIAIYYQAMRVMGHGGDYYQGPAGKEDFVHDHWMIFHVYPKALCEWWGWFLVDLWKAYHGNWSFDEKTAVARKVGLNAPGEKPPVAGAGEHVEAALRWTDPDGVSRFHLFDGNMGYFAYAPGTARVASPEEIKAGFPDVLLKPHNPPKPYFVLSSKHGDAESDPAFRKFLGNTYPFVYSGQRKLTRYKTDFDLRKGESLRRQWYDDRKPVVPKRYKDIGIPAMTDGAGKYMYAGGEPKDPYNFPVQRPYFRNYPEMGLAKPFGNAISSFAPELADGKFKVGALSTRGLDSKKGSVGATAPGVEGEVVYQIRSIYPFAESIVSGSYRLESKGRVDVDFSLDEGKTWHSVLTTTEVKDGAVPFSLDLGKGRWDKDLPSTYNMADRDSQYCDGWEPAKVAAVRYTGFQYQVRVRVLADADVAKVGLASLRFDNVHQLNIGMLPTLLPGNNVITVEGEGLTPGSALKIEYEWQENGAPRSRVETAVKLPHVFEIQVAEKDPLKVKCLHQTLTVVGR